MNDNIKMIKYFTSTKYVCHTKGKGYKIDANIL